MPKFMRDFHDQKELFKAIDETTAPPPDGYNVSWVQAHVYTTDRFLAFMARHGYRLRRVNKDAPNVEDTVEECCNQRRKIAIKTLMAPIVEIEDPDNQKDPPELADDWSPCADCANALDGHVNYERVMCQECVNFPDLVDNFEQKRR